MEAFALRSRLRVRSRLLVLSAEADQFCLFSPTVIPHSPWNAGPGERGDPEE